MPDRSEVRTEFFEPACWGSAELPLVPVSLVRAVKGSPITGLVKVNKDRSKTPLTIDLSMFASEAWRGWMAQFQIVDEGITLLDKVVEATSRVYAAWPDRLDLPVLSVPLDDILGAGDLPFEVETWRLLSDCGATNNVEIAVLLTGTFREMMERVGDVRACLDLAVTGQAWIDKTASGGYRFQRPVEPDSLAEAAFQLRRRTFRCRGIAFAGSSYTARVADALGMRWGIAQSGRYTLDEAAHMIGLTRERLRQLEKRSLWEPAIRAWGRPLILEQCHKQLLGSSDDSVTIAESDEKWSREDAEALLVDFGYPSEDFEPPWTVENELTELGIKISEIKRLAYRETESVGFVTRQELRLHLSENYPQLTSETLNEVISWLAIVDNLPYDYVYLESSHGSRARLGFERLLATFGPLQLEEAVVAVKRGLRHSLSRHVFPPFKVIEEFIRRHDEFWLEEGVIGLNKPIRNELSGMEKWVFDTITSCTGQVIHRTELWERGRANGMRNGTMSVYSQYSRYFKPVGRNCVTVTGRSPSDAMIALAVKRAQAIRVKTRRLKLEIEDDLVRLTVEVGNEMLDGGLLRGNVETRRVLGGRRFRALVGGEQFGHVSWSSSIMIGYASSLQQLEVQPGDVVLLNFDLSTGELELEMVTD
jgi:hypothetical protein